MIEDIEVEFQPCFEKRKN